MTAVVQQGAPAATTRSSFEVETAHSSATAAPVDSVASSQQQPQEGTAAAADNRRGERGWGARLWAAVVAVAVEKPAPAVAGVSSSVTQLAEDEEESDQGDGGGNGWRKPLIGRTDEGANMQSTVKVPGRGAGWTGWMPRYAAFMGIGFMVSVGYMDPGNWATDLVAGSRYGYTLLAVVLLSNIVAIFLQCLVLKLGVATDRDLAQACRDAYSKWAVRCLWVLMELAIAATDLAELIGSATALYLLFRIPIWAGVLVTGVDVFLILFLGARSVRALEFFVFVLVMLIAVCFAVELAAAQPDWVAVARGYIPSGEIVADTEMLYVAIGILGATVMPHNLFLHSSAIQTRAYPRTLEGRKMAIKYGRSDVVFALLFAFYVNSAILILAAAAFHYGPEADREVEDITEAYKLLSGAIGQRGAEILFGVSLLASGQSSSITGTLAGQIVMSGFLNLRVKPWVRRMVTRTVAMVPAAIVAAVSGNSGASNLLVLSQVILSVTLTFAVAPLVHITSTRAKMGTFVNGWITTIAATTLTLIVGGVNIFLVVQAARGAT